MRVRRLGYAFEPVLARSDVDTNSESGSESSTANGEDDPDPQIHYSW